MISLFLFLALTLPLPSPFLANIAPKFESSFATYKDAGFQNQSVNFSASEPVFVKVETKITGEDEKSLRLLNSEKQKVTDLELSKTNFGFSANFSAPATEGVYYLDLKLRTQTSTFSAQRNINVGETDGDVRSEVRSQLGSDSSTPTLSPIVEPPSPPKPPDLTTFFQDLLAKLTKFFTELKLRLFLPNL